MSKVSTPVAESSPRWRLWALTVTITLLDWLAHPIMSLVWLLEEYRTALRRKEGSV